MVLPWAVHVAVDLPLEELMGAVALGLQLAVSTTYSVLIGAVVGTR